MAAASVERRLSAILALDLVGFSRLMARDEEGTHHRVQALLHDVIMPAVSDAHGRVVKLLGDGVLAEFPAVSQAIGCALQIQGRAQEREADEPEETRFLLRIGINLGDVIVDGDDIYGDGVNIAARLESIAEPGTVLVSEAAMQIADRVAFRFIDLGLRQLKNIGRRLRVFRALPADAPEAPALPALSTHVPGFGDRPAIAVLPLRNQSADPEREYLADGMTEDIITELSAWRIFPVIARNSAFAYKGKVTDLRVIGSQLGARYVLEGSLRPAGKRLRITTQLNDVETGQTLFAERYDRGAKDMAVLQDEIVQEIVGALEPELLKHERERAASAASGNPTAYDLYQRGMWHHYHYTPGDSLKAQAFFRNALAVDPDFGHAASALAVSLCQAVISNYDPAENEAMLEEAERNARHALRCDARDPSAHFAMGVVRSHIHQAEAALEALEEAGRLNPSYAAAHAFRGFVLNYLHRPDEAIRSIELALRLSPHDPRRFLWLPALASSHYLSGRYEAALEVTREAQRLNPDYLVAARYEVACLGQLGRQEEAPPAIARLRHLDAGLPACEVVLRRYFVPEAAEHIIAGLRKAGFE